MRHKYLVGNAVLWAAAVVAAAIVGAPTVLTLILLPALGFVSLLLVWRVGGKAAGSA